MSTKDPIRRRTRFGAITILAAAGTVGLAGPAYAGDVASGRNLEMAPGIDFALFEAADLEGKTVLLEVRRGTTLVASKTDTVSGGIIEVNHVGPAAAGGPRGDCWDGPGTPDLRGGDELRATVLDGTTPPADVDRMFARQITFTAAGNALTGDAFGDDVGTRVPLVVGPDDVFAAKRISPDGKFSGVLSDPDPTTGAWTGTLPGQNGEVSVDFSTSHPGEGAQTTTAFVGAEETTGPCGDVRQSAMTSNSHPEIKIANVGTPMVVGGPEAGEGQATGVTFGGRSYPATPGGAGWSATIPAADLAALTEGAHTLVATFSDGTSDTRTVIKDVTAPTLTSSLAPGTYTGNQTTTLTSDTEGIRYTLDGSEPTTTFGTPHAGGSPITLTQGSVSVLRARVQDAVGNVTTLGPLSYDVRTPPPGTNDTGGTQNAGTTQTPGGTAGTVSGTTTPPAGLIGASGGSSFFGLTRLRPGVVRVASKARLRTVRRLGLGLKVDLPAGATLMQVRIARRVAGRDRAVRTITVPVIESGTIATRLADRKLRAAFRPGTYILRIATGRSALTLGDAVTARVRIVR